MFKRKRQETAREQQKDNNNDESDNEQSRTEESVATGERGFSLWYALSAAIASLGAGLALTGKKRRKDEE